MEFGRAEATAAWTVKMLARKRILGGIGVRLKA